jgi:hypothetical protein
MKTKSYLFAIFLSAIAVSATAATSKSDEATKSINGGLKTTWLLYSFFVSSLQSHGAAGAISIQEFNSQGNCEDAAKRLAEATDRMIGQYKFACVLK